METLTENNYGECLVLDVDAEKFSIKEEDEVKEITWQIKNLVGDRD